LDLCEVLHLTRTNVLCGLPNQTVSKFSATYTAAQLLLQLAIA